MKKNLLSLFILFSCYFVSAQTVVNMHNGITDVNPGDIIEFYDSGGASGDYGNNENFTHTFASVDGSPLQILFKAFNVESNSCSYDYMYIYDGGTVNSPDLTGKLCGSPAGMPGPFTSTRDSLTVTFKTDASDRYNGWEAIVFSSSIQPQDFVMKHMNANPFLRSNQYLDIFPGGAVEITIEGDFTNNDTYYNQNVNNTTFYWEVKNNSNTTIARQNGKARNTFNYTFNNAGTFTVLAYARDVFTHLSSDTLKYTVKVDPANSFFQDFSIDHVTSTPALSGNALNILQLGNISIEVTPDFYENNTNYTQTIATTDFFWVIKDSDDNVVKSQNGLGLTTFSYTFNSSGTYSLWVYGKDIINHISDTLEYVVNVQSVAQDFSIDYVTSTPALSGNALNILQLGNISIEVTPDFYENNTNYTQTIATTDFFWVIKDSDDNVIKSQNGLGLTTFSYTFNSSGTHSLWVYGKDTINHISDTLEYVVNVQSVAQDFNIKYLNSVPALRNDTFMDICSTQSINMSIDAEFLNNNISYYQQISTTTFYWEIKDAGNNIIKTQNGKGLTNFTYTFPDIGTYKVNVYAKDSIAHPSTDTLKYITEVTHGGAQPFTLKYLSSTPSLTDVVHLNICQNTSLNLKMEADFANNDVNYHQELATTTFYWTINGTDKMDTFNGVAMDELVHTFIKQGGSYVTVYARDVNGCRSENEAEYKVRVSGKPDFTGTLITPSSVCENIPVTLTGVTQNYEWVVGDKEGEETFLPDGSGVSYRSDMNVMPFDKNAVITSENDIEKILLNLEHSYLGDLSINLICPNGQKAVLKAYNTSTSVSNPNISGSSGGGYTHLGFSPDPDNNTDPCYLIPGEGMDYWFTPGGTNPFGNNGPTTSVTYTDACGRTETWNQLNSGEYGTYEHLSSLVGCPVNGLWTIEVTDHIGSDNGYIFYWSIDFAQALYPPVLWSYNNTVVSTVWTGENITTTSGNNATALPLSTGDVAYTYTVTDDYGCSYDTVLIAKVHNVIQAGRDTIIYGNTTYQLNADSITDGYSRGRWTVALGNAANVSFANDTLPKTNVSILNDDYGTYKFAWTKDIPSGLNCPDTDTVQVVFVDIPTVDPLNSITVCPDVARDTIKLNGTGYPEVFFTWSSDIAIGLADETTGAKHILPFIPVNNTGAPITATITVTPHVIKLTDGSRYVGNPENFTITVNPKATITNSLQDVIACAGDLTPEVNFTGIAAEYRWIAKGDNIGVPINTVSTGDIMRYQLSNNSDSIQYVNIETYPVYGTDSDGNTCIGDTVSFKVSVKAIPLINLQDKTITYNAAEQLIDSVTVEINNISIGEKSWINYTYLYNNTPLGNMPVNAGIYEAVAEFAGNSTYCASIPDTATLVINAADLHIQADNKTKRYGYNDPALTWQITNGSLFGTDQLTAGSLKRANGEDIGIYTIDEDVTFSAGSNYNVIFTPAALNIIANNEAEIEELLIDNDNWDIDDVYQIDCGNTADYLEIKLTASPGAIVTAAGYIIDHTGTITLDITANNAEWKIDYIINAQDGSESSARTLIVKKHFSFNAIIVQKFDNILVVNNNSQFNGGYKFADYQWFKIQGNDTLAVSTKQYYSAGNNVGDVLDKNAEYYVILKTVTGEEYETCPAKVTLSGNIQISIYPNPAIKGMPVYVDADVSDEMLQNGYVELYDLFGTQLKSIAVSGRVTVVNMPNTAGVYVISFKSGTYVKSMNIIVK